jgi:hypothetical protein
MLKIVHLNKGGLNEKTNEKTQGGNNVFSYSR